MRGRVLLAVVVLTLLSGVAAHGQVTLVADGEPRATVVVPDDAEPVARYAAEELVLHIERATGATLPIAEESKLDDVLPHRVYVGSTRAARDAGIDVDALPAEVAIVRTVGDALYIVGRDGPGDPLSIRTIWSGTLWGAYELLEQEMGVRWLWPGELGTHVPATDELAFDGLDLRFEPAFGHRHVRTVTGNAAWPNDPRWGFTEAGEAAYAEAEKVYLRRHRMGTSGDPRPVSSSHAFSHGWWDRYGEAHPEWFAMAPDGTRGPSDEFDRYGEVPMCVSNEALQDYLVAQWAERRAAEPDGVHVIYLGESNTWARCVCEPCKAWDEPQLTDEELSELDAYIQLSLRHRLTGEPFDAGPRYARFWKEVHAKASAIDPDVIVSTFAYMNYFAAPQRDMELHPNIVLSFVPWTSWWFPRTDAEQQWVKDQWDRWRELGATLGYRPNFTFDGYAMPHVYTHQMADVIQHFAVNGSIGNEFDSLTAQWATQGPALYVLMRLQTHPRADVDGLLAEYYQGFGPAAGAVRDYFAFWEDYTMGSRDRIEDAKERHNARRYFSYAKIAHEVFPLEVLEEGQHLLDRAIVAVAESGNATQRQRVAFLQDGLDHARLCVSAAALFADESATADERRAALEALRDFRRSVEDRFIAGFNWLCYQESTSWSGTPGFFE